MTQLIRSRLGKKGPLSRQLIHSRTVNNQSVLRRESANTHIQEPTYGTVWIPNPPNGERNTESHEWPTPDQARLTMNIAIPALVYCQLVQHRRASQTRSDLRSAQSPFHIAPTLLYRKSKGIELAVLGANVDYTIGYRW